MSVKTILYCNTSSINVHVFIFAVDWLFHNPSGFAEDIVKEQQLLEAMSFLAITRSAFVPGELSLSGALHRGIWLQCSEPLDRVFGLLGFARHATRERTAYASLTPDYTRSVVDVYCDATRYCIGECNPPWLLDLLGYDRNSDNMIEGLPTWVPSWYYGEKEIHNRHRATGLPDSMQLWKKLSSSVNLCLVPESSVEKVLSIRGVIVGAISKHSDTVIPSISSDSSLIVDFMSNAGKLLLGDDMLIGIFSNHYRLDHVLSAGCRDVDLMRWWLECLQHVLNPIMRLGANDVQAPTPHPAGPSEQEKTQSDDSDGRSPETPIPGVSAMRKFREALIYCYKRKVFLTQTGLLGIGPKALQDGDIIAVSMLSQRPMVLRRAEGSGPDHYTVLGAAFVEGITSGEEVFAAAAKGEGIGTIHLV